MKFVIIAMFLVLVTPIIGCIDNSDMYEDCTVPRGTYNCTWDVGRGDCPPEIINVITSAPCGIELSVDSACNLPFSFEYITEDAGCTITEDYFGETGSSGIAYSSLIIEVDCPEIFCTQEVHMNF